MLVYKKPMPGLSLPPRTCWRHWKHANVGILGPRVTIVYQRNDAAASEPIQPPGGERQPRRVLRCRRTDARKTAPRPSLMKLFKLLSQGRAVELRAAQQMLTQFARLKSS